MLEYHNTTQHHTGLVPGNGKVRHLVARLLTAMAAPAGLVPGVGTVHSTAALWWHTSSPAGLMLLS